MICEARRTRSSTTIVYNTRDYSHGYDNTLVFRCRSCHSAAKSSFETAILSTPTHPPLTHPPLTHPPSTHPPQHTQMPPRITRPSISRNPRYYYGCGADSVTRLFSQCVRQAFHAFSPSFPYPCLTQSPYYTSSLFLPSLPL